MTCTASVRASTHPEVEPSLLRDSRIEPCQEPAERRPVGARREGGGDIGERVEVSPRCARRPPGSGQHLDVEAERDLCLGRQLREPETRERTQSTHRGAEPAQPLECHRGDRLSLRARPGGRRQVVQGLDDAGLLARVAGEVGSRGGHEPIAAARGPTPPARRGRLPRAARRSGEQAHQLVAAGRVLHHPEQGDEVARPPACRAARRARPPRTGSRAPRRASTHQRRTEDRLPAQHGGAVPVRRPVASTSAPRASAATWSASSSTVVEPGRRDVPDAGTRARRSGATGTRCCEQRLRRRRWPTSSTSRSLRQLVDSGSTPAGPRVDEVRAEPQQGRRARAAPAVDRLVAGPRRR